MSFRHLFVDTVVHLAPLQMIEDLSPGDAIRSPGHHMHSVAGLVAHMAFWQDWFLQRVAGVAVPMPAHAAAGWPDVKAADWPALRDRFARGLEAYATLGDEASLLTRPVMPSIDVPGLETYTRHDVAIHVAQHNSHHLGQVVSARQALGLWPPRAGSWTW